MDDLDVGFYNGSIQLEATPTVYYSGQTIHGCVVFKLKRPLTFATLCVRFIGEGNVSWTDIENKDCRTWIQPKEETYKNHEVYFNEMEVLAGGHGSVKLPSTSQKIPFKFQIPFSAPSSFKGKYGSVSYTIIATMVYPDLRKEELTKEFDVVAPLDLNNHPVKDSVKLSFSDNVKSCHFICFWCSHSLIIRTKLPVTGYCPGQIIPAAVEVENYSGVDVTRFRFEIITRELYRSREPASKYKLREKIIFTKEHDGVGPRSKRNFTCDVPVPDMIPPYVKHCTIIDIGYFFRVTIKLSGFNDNLQGETKIYLGNVPINEAIHGTYVHPMASFMPSGPITTPNDVYSNVNESNEHSDEDNENKPMLYPRI